MLVPARCGALSPSFKNGIDICSSRTGTSPHL